MDKEIGWELYRSFLAVVQEGSLSAAARVLDIAQPTVGRHVELLEKSLGLPLFIRSQTGLAPTEAALELLPYAESIKSTVAALKRTAESHGDGIKGAVRVTASEVIGVEVLPSILSRLLHEHPDLKVELVISNRVQDLLRREADIAVRMTQPRQESLIAKRVGDVELGMYARKDYLKRYGCPNSIAELEKHTLIGFDEETPFLRAGRKTLPVWRRDAFSARADSDLAQLALIRAGAGIGVCQAALAKRDPGLVRVLGGAFSMKLETWLVMHEDLRNSPRCRVVFDALFQGLQKHAGV